MAYLPSGLAFSTLSKEGANLDLCTTIDTVENPEYPAAPFVFGERTIGTDASEWIYVEPAGAYAVGTVGYIDANWEFHALTTTNAAANNGMMVGVMSQVASVTASPSATNYDGVWAQIAGGCAALQVSASAAANVQLYTTATAGQLSDTPSAGFVNNVVLTVAEGGSAGTTTALLNFPLTATAA
jgi:hypothetical protein